MRDEPQRAPQLPEAHPLRALEEQIINEHRPQRCFYDEDVDRQQKADDILDDILAFAKAHPGLRDSTVMCAKCEVTPVAPDNGVGHDTSWMGKVCHPCFAADPSGARMLRFSEAEDRRRAAAEGA